MECIITALALLAAIGFMLWVLQLSSPSHYG
jgi:hypothetical protein